MPGPISDDYDPIWITGYNADRVRDAIQDVQALVASYIGSPPKHMLEVIEMHGQPTHEYAFTEPELRIIRFCLKVALGEEEI